MQLPGSIELWQFYKCLFPLTPLWCIKAFTAGYSKAFFYRKSQVNWLLSSVLVTIKLFF